MVPYRLQAEIATVRIVEIVERCQHPQPCIDVHSVRCLTHVTLRGVMGSSVSPTLKL